MPNTLVPGNRNDDTRFWTIHPQSSSFADSRRTGGGPSSSSSSPRAAQSVVTNILVFIFFDIFVFFFLRLKIQKKKLHTFRSAFFLSSIEREKKITRTTICRLSVVASVRSSSCRSWRASSRRSSLLDRRAGFIYPASRLRVRRCFWVWALVVHYWCLLSFNALLCVMISLSNLNFSFVEKDALSRGGV